MILLLKGCHSGIPFKILYESGSKCTIVCPQSMKIRVRGDRITISGIIEEAKKNGIEYKTIHDAGRTEIEAGSLTVLSLGPDVEEKLENLCSFLPIID